MKPPIISLLDSKLGQIVISGAHEAYFKSSCVNRAFLWDGQKGIRVLVQVSRATNTRLNFPNSHYLC